MNVRRSAFSSALSLSVCLFAAGCGVDSSPATPVQTSLGRITGQVKGGRAPIIGAHIYVYAAATTAVGAGSVVGNTLGGYGGSGLAATADNASVSLLTNYSTGSFPTTFDGTNYYVTTDSLGSFALTGEYTCTAGQDIYLYSAGGDTGSGTPNPAATLMAILGTCPSSGTMADLTPFVVMNEVSTVAAAFAFAGFATDPLHVGSDEGAGPAYTARQALAKQGMATAFANSNLLYSLPYGGGGARPTTASGDGTVPQTRLHSLGNSLAACVNSTGAGSSACTALLGAATNANSGNGTAATDTAAAALNIAHFPSQNVSAIYMVDPGTSSPYLPKLSSAPVDWTIGIYYSNASLSSPYGIAIDASGNAWVTNTAGNNVAEISSAGAFLSGTTGFNSPEMNSPNYVAVDLSGNVWVTSLYSNTVTKFSSSGAVLSGTTGFTGGGLNGPGPIAIDTAGNAWIANYQNPGSLSELSPAGVPLSPSAGFTGGGLSYSEQIGFDGAAHLWAIDQAHGISKFTTQGVALSPANGYQGTSQTLYYPQGLSIDAAGYIWVSSNNSKTSKFTQSGTLAPGSPYAGGGQFSTAPTGIDGAGNVWIPNNSIGDVAELANDGTPLSLSKLGTTAVGYQQGNLNYPESLAIDGSGDVWVTDAYNNQILEMIGVAVPIMTPLVAALPVTPTADGSSNLGTRP